MNLKEIVRIALLPLLGPVTTGVIIDVSSHLKEMTEHATIKSAQIQTINLDAYKDLIITRADGKQDTLYGDSLGNYLKLPRK